MNNVAAPLLVSLLLTAGVYVWTAASLQAVFRKAGEAGWQGWVPVYNLIVLLRLAGLSGWWVLLILVPFGWFVVVGLAGHRVSAAFGFGGGMTVLAVLLFPVWSSILGWGSARWLGREQHVPGPVRGRATALDTRLGAPGFGGPVPPAYPPAPGYPAAAPVPPQPSVAPTYPPLPPLPTGLRADAAAVPPPTAVPPRPADPATDGDDDDLDPLPAQRRGGGPQLRSTLRQDARAAAAAPAPSSDAAPAAAVPAVVRPAATADPAATAPEPAAPLDHDPAAEPGGPVAAPRRAVPQVDDEVEDSGLDGPSASAPAVPGQFGAVPAPRSAGSGDLWAPPEESPPARRSPARATAFSDTSAEVSAVAGAPALGAPLAARSSVSALRTAPELPDADSAFDETIIASRHRTPWMLTPPLGAAIAVTSDVLIIGRRPSSDPSYPNAQLVSISDETRTMSKTHARLVLADGRWSIVDLESTNGVVLFGADGREIEIEPGAEHPVVERFLLGDAELALVRTVDAG